MSIFRFLCVILLLAAPAIARAEWHEASSDHFLVYSDDKPDKIREFATQLERFDKTLRFLRNISSEPIGKANRVIVYMVTDIAAIQKLYGGYSVAGFYSPRAGESSAFVPRDTGIDSTPPEYREMMLTPQQILLHEYTHHFLLSLSTEIAYPGWFVEGYAEFFASSKFEPDGSVVIGLPPQYRGWDLSGENRLTSKRMLSGDPTTLTGEQRYLTYARGWLLTHYLLLGGARDGQLGGYFRALNEGKSPADAALVFGDLAKLDTELWKYRRTTFPATRVAAAVLPIGEVTIRKLGVGEAATMPARLRSTAGVNEKQAPGVYAAAKKACDPYPNDPAAQRVLAEAAFDAKDYAGAEAAADRAIAADPKAVGALLYKARARIELAKQAKDMTPATWTAIRRLISAANRIDTENPQPLMLYYQSFVAAGQAPPKAARDGLYYAYMLAPQDRGLRFNAAEAYLREGNPAKARPLLQTLAIDPHGGGPKSLAARMVAAIDAGHPEQAIAELEKPPETDKKDDKKARK